MSNEKQKAKPSTAKNMALFPPRPCLKAEDKTMVAVSLDTPRNEEKETPVSSYNSSSKRPISASGSDSSRIRTKQFVDRLNSSNAIEQPSPRNTGARFPSQSLGDRMKRMVNAISHSLIPPSAPSESMTNATDLDTNRGESEWGAGAEFRLTSARSRRESLSSQHTPGDGHARVEEQAIDVTVIDRDWAEILDAKAGGSFGVAGSDTAISPNLDSGGLNGLGITGNSIVGSREALSPSDTEGPARSQSGVSQQHTTTSFRDLPPYNFFRWRFFPAIIYFFEPSFTDPAKEQSYVKESWFIQKPAAIAGALFFYLVWILTMATQTMPIPTYNKITYCSICAAFISPALFIVARDWPRNRPWTYNCVLWCTVWVFPYSQIFDMWDCGFYTSHPDCHSKDFIGIFFWSLAFPTFALFMMSQKRIFVAVGAIVYIILIIILILPDRPKFSRNLINFIVFHVAIQWSSFLQEKSHRRMFSMREQLKAQYKATQKAQVAERRTADSKKRFVSYIFHEVRVPLNTALLAFQNLDGEDVFKQVPEDSREIVTGLSSSLIQMEKVLNDVLDMNRMEAGKLTCLNKPLELHPTIRQTLMAFRGVAAAKQIDLVTDLDSAIDAFSPYLLGDEMRISQIISNLTSNACKFTPVGGKVTVKSRLIHPSAADKAIPRASTELLEKPDIIIPIDGETGPGPRSNHPAGEEAEAEAEKERELRKDVAIVRIEVTDSGVGIRPRDLVDNRLFSPYVQTDIGRRQGGKGSGLGLALIRQIIKLSGGRLGVRSSVDTGSTFWFELPFGKAASRHPDKRLSNMPRDVSILQALDSPQSRPPSPGARSGGLNIPGIIPQVTGSLTDVLKNPVQRAELVASQIPIARNEAGIPVSDIPALTPIDHTQTSNLKVLVVDDDNLTRKLMTRMISRMGHEVTSAEDGLICLNLLRDAWEAKDENRYDIVFLDNQMPNMTGVECVQEARRIGLRTYICGCTGNALLQDQAEYLEAGVDRILTKPILERNVRDVLEEARQKSAEIRANTAPSSDYIMTPHHPTS